MIENCLCQFALRLKQAVFESHIPGRNAEARLGEPMGLSWQRLQPDRAAAIVPHYLLVRQTPPVLRARFDGVKQYVLQSR